MLEDPFESFGPEKLMELLIQQSGRDRSDIAPIFCNLFGENVYLVRKYIRHDYCIDPLTTIGRGKWLFSPPQPTYLEDFVKLERKTREPQQFFMASDNSFEFMRTHRVEAILKWCSQTKNPRVLRTGGLSGDLTSPDDSIVEATVAFLLARAWGVAPSAVTYFSEAGKNGKTPEFRVDVGDCVVLVEVKHLRKQPQSEAERRWLELCGSVGKPKAGSPYPLDELAMKSEQSTEKVFQYDELPWQNSTKSIHNLLNDANEKFRAVESKVAGNVVRVTVVHSDDPYCVTRMEDAANDSRLANRTEVGIWSWLQTDAPDSTDAVILLANPQGIPIGTGYCARAFFVWQEVNPVLRLLEDHFPALVPNLMTHTRFGIEVKLAPNETTETELSVGKNGHIEIKVNQG